MAKINRFIASFTAKIKEIDLAPVENTMPPKHVVRKFVRLFKSIDDPRVPAMTDYPLEEILLMAFLAVLGNASTWTEIEIFGNTKRKWLKKFMKLKNGIPSHDTFERVFSLIDTQQLQNATVAFLMENPHAIKKSLGVADSEYRLICVDGKEQRGTGRKYDYDDKVKNLQTLHIFDASNEICIYSEAINEKTNEIPVAKKALASMNLKDCIVTFDALHTQKETIETIRAAKGHYVGGLKGNQSGLLEEAAAYFNEKELLDFYSEKGDYFESAEKAHGRIEKRKYYLVRPTKRKIIKEWKNLKSFICLIKEMEDVNSGKKTTETRYYISDLDDTKLIAEAIRGHWGVENNLHWHLDFSFREDENTTMDKAAFNNLSLINKMALSICKLSKILYPKASIRVIRKMAGWEIEDYLTNVLGSFDEEMIKRAMENIKA